MRNLPDAIGLHTISIEDLSKGMAWAKRKPHRFRWSHNILFCLKHNPQDKKIILYRELAFAP